MLPWLRAIARETAPAVLALLSGLSTLATFVTPKLAGYPRAVLAVCFVAGFGWANLRIYKKQQKQIRDCEDAQGVQIVRNAILDAKNLIVYWKTQAARIAPPPYGNPDPTPLASSTLLGAAGQAWKISDVCAQLIREAHSALRSAKSELEKAYETARHQSVLGPLGTRATAYLETADGLLDKALALVNERLKNGTHANQ
jgi:hypothetical protein